MEIHLEIILIYVWARNCVTGWREWCSYSRAQAPANKSNLIGFVGVDEARDIIEWHAIQLKFIVCIRRLCVCAFLFVCVREWIGVAPILFMLTMIQTLKCICLVRCDTNYDSTDCRTKEERSEAERLVRERTMVEPGTLRVKGAQEWKQRKISEWKMNSINVIIKINRFVWELQRRTTEKVSESEKRVLKQVEKATSY